MENGIHWGDVATWVTGIATIALFVVAFWQINIERAERKRQNKEAVDRQKRDQAEHITSWIVGESKEVQDNPRAWIAILNQSAMPVYDVVISMVMVQGSGSREGIGTPQGYRVSLSVVSPGKSFTSVAATYHGMHRHPGIEIAFKDVAGISWVRKANGDLLNIEQSTITYYGLDLPVGWQRPQINLPQALMRE